MASEKETIPKDDKKDEEAAKNTNGDKNGDSTASIAKLSLGEIAAIDGEIAKAKTEQLQVLHNLFYGKNGSGPQIKRGIRKFAGFEEADKQKKLDELLKSELPAIKQTATILDLKDIKTDETKENIAQAIVDFLMSPTGKTFEEVQKDEPEDEVEPEPAEESEEEEVEVKAKPKKGRGSSSSAGRPKRATASRVWTNDYGSSEEEEIEEARPRVGRKKRGDDTDSGSDYNPSGGGSDSDADRRKSSRNSVPARPTRGGGRGRRGKDSESEEESELSEEFSDEEVVPAKKKKAPAGNRSVPKRGAAQKGKKRKQDSESEEEVSEDESLEEDIDSDDSAKQKKVSRKTVTPKTSPQKGAKGRPKRAAPPAKKKRKDASSEDDDDEEPDDGSEDDEPLKKPPVKKGAKEDGTPSDDDIKKLLKDILAEANLEEITMKTVCKKVYAHYPNHDLSSRKDFIKQTVKSLIAA